MATMTTKPHVARACQQFLDDEGIDAIDWTSGMSCIAAQATQAVPGAERCLQMYVEHTCTWSTGTRY